MRFFPPALWRTGWKYLVRHTWQSILMVIGITLGVAVVVSIDIANANASRAFTLSTEGIAGRATHEIVGGPQGVPEEVYRRLRQQLGLQSAAPVIQEYVTSPDLGNRPFQLLGIDPFAEAPFRSYLNAGSTLSETGLVSFLTNPGSVLLSEPVASRYHLSQGSSFSLVIAGKETKVILTGLLQPTNSLDSQTLDGLILADISTAQELTGREGYLDRIDLILPDSSKKGVDVSTLQQEIKGLLPGDCLLEPVGSSQGSLAQLSSAFQVNLTALSLLALVVGLFLIYNTMTFSVVQRRPLFGTLRSLGVTRREVFLLVLCEALMVGILGSFLGILLGIWMGQFTVRMVLQTINDLYFTTTVSQVSISFGSILKGGLLGIFATVLTTIPPAWEAASVPPRIALLRSSIESKARSLASTSAIIGIGLLCIGGLVLMLPLHDLVSGFTATLVVIVGFALLTALFLVVMMRWVMPFTSHLFSTTGRMAPRNLIVALSRTSIAVAALMVAVSVTIGVSLMIDSFRHTVVIWLGETLQSDIYISVPTFTGTAPTDPIDPQVIRTVSGIQGIARVDLLRSVTINSLQGPIQVAATNNSSLGQERLFLTLDVSPGKLWDAMQNNSVIISEPLANRLGLPRRGGAIELFTPAGLQTFHVLGIYYDYSSSQGTMMISLDQYQKIWKDDSVTALGVRLIPGSNAGLVTQKLQDAVSLFQQVLIRPNAELRQEVLSIFDRTFAITRALQLLATVVAFFGVLSALMLLQAEKQREIGILRALGMTVRQLWGMVLMETGLMGTVAGLLAMPTGLVLSIILIYIINRRSFGWTLQMALTPGPFLQALAVALGASLLAGLYPAFRLGRMLTSEAIRYE
jgi:putative ABC transport system permease protein